MDTTVVDTTGLAPLDGGRTLEERAYQRLRHSIASGQIAPGTKLVGSRLATTLGVSRITVANALKRLASEGFLVLTPHKEAVVAELDEASLREVFAIRQALEDMVLRAAADRRDAAAIKRLRAIDREIQIAAEAYALQDYRRLDRDFHLALYAMSGFPLMTGLLTDLWDRIEPYRGRRYTTLGLQGGTHADHEAIVAAIEAGDGETAIAVMRRHVASGYERYLQVLRDLAAARAERSGPA